MALAGLWQVHAHSSYKMLFGPSRKFEKSLFHARMRAQNCRSVQVVPTFWTYPILLVLLAAEQPADSSPAANGPAVMEASIERQRGAVRKQVSAMEVSGWFILPPPAPLPPSTTRLPASNSDCPALSQQELQPLIDEAAKAAGLKADWLAAVVRQKSDGRPCAVSPAGAQGLMQLMPAALEQFAVANPFDPRENLASGARLLKQLLDLHAGDSAAALAAYNAGPSTADRTGQPPISPSAQTSSAPAEKSK